MNIKMYSQYICLFGNEEGLQKTLERRLNTFLPPECITARNLSGMSHEEANFILNNALVAERMRVYNPDGGSTMYAKLFYTDRQKYLLMLSVCDGMVSDIPSIYRRLFGNNPEEAFDMYGVHKADAGECEAYWRSMFYDKRLTFPVQKQLEEFDPAIEKFPVNDNLKKLIARCIENKNRSIKSVCYAVLGQMACMACRGTRVLVIDSHEGGKLTFAPIIYNSDEDTASQYESVKKQLQNAERYDNLSNVSLKHATGIDFLHTPMASAYFIHEGKYQNFFDKMKDDTVYSLMAYNANMCPLTVVFDISKDTSEFTYIYDERAFEGFDIQKIHDLYCRLLEAFIKNEEVDDAKETAEIRKAGTDVNADRVLNAKINCLKKIPMFKNHADSELLKIAGEIKVFPSRIEQNIATIGAHLSGLFIPVNGKMMILGRDMDGYLNPIYIAKVGEILGGASLLDDSRSSVCIKTASSDTLILYISKELFIEEAYKHPAMWKEILAEQQNVIDKLERLWLMS